MPLMIYNTLSRKKEPFEPIEPGKVRMYVCGVTVYDYSHLGHARSYIGWDMVRRYLTWRGYQVHYVQNFTDIDDKIIRRSQELGIPWQTLTQTYIDAYKEDMGRLNVLPADAYPQATEVIPEIVAFIQQLINQGYAYEAAGDVYYAVERFPSYGKLSGRKLEQMEAGASGRVEEEDRKHHPFDFALWKAAKPGEPEWESPWGVGRPGWHIECSAMVKQLLGDAIDIHTGGEDLIFPHHENEIAQSEAALAKPLARYWMHNAFVKIQGDKMSKSLNNFTTIRSLLETTDPMVIRLFTLQAHYRSPIDFTDQAIASANSGWETLREGLQMGYLFAQELDDDLKKIRVDKEKCEKFEAAMDDDLNTPQAIAILFDLAKTLKKEINEIRHTIDKKMDWKDAAKRWKTLVKLSDILGLTDLPSEPLTNKELLEKIKVFTNNAIQESNESPAYKELAKSCGYYTRNNTKLKKNFFDVSVRANNIRSFNSAMQCLEDFPNDESSDAEIEALIQQRQEARKAKNFAEGDRIRNQLQEKGITLIDQPGGATRWHRG